MNGWKAAHHILQHKLHARICHPTLPRPPPPHSQQPTRYVTEIETEAQRGRWGAPSDNNNKEKGQIHTPRSSWLAAFLIHHAIILKKGKWLSPQYQRCTFSPIHFFLSASLGQPGAGHATSHSALPEPMFPSLLCQRRQEGTVFTNKCFGGEKKQTWICISSHPPSSYSACTSPLCTCFHSHKVGIIIYFMRIRYKNMYNLNLESKTVPGTKNILNKWKTFILFSSFSSIFSSSNSKIVVIEIYSECEKKPPSYHSEHNTPGHGQLVHMLNLSHSTFNSHWT